ncbi:hypothetical protein GDO81_011850 [Engystomops pustulosus]|uniref:Uncharacterized protein n=1 Tax=Engystomops pustulosus TaxID=76066 RepID=A0AAV7BH83_ENGPU|nr:hypothetical protein GDO81_011850 [Engystomops pustulosus]
MNISDSFALDCVDRTLQRRVQCNFRLLPLQNSQPIDQILEKITVHTEPWSMKPERQPSATFLHVQYTFIFCEHLPRGIY